MTPQPVVRIEDLVVTYGDVRAVDGVSLDVFEEELAALVGPSGCGKTSLLRTIAGFETPGAGRVVIGGTPVCGAGKPVPPEGRDVGMVFQDGALFPHMTVARNIGYGVENRPDGNALRDAAIELVGLEKLAHRYPDQLSGGQQQLVALARALAPAPRLVLLDEPFASLDASLRARLRDEVRTILRRARATAILVTHDQEEALSLADRVAVMQRGQLLQVGTPEQIYHRPDSVELARFIGGGQFLNGRVASGRLECCLGRLSTDAPEGECLLLVRPEDLLVLPEGDTGGVPVRLVEHCFYGHDRLDEVELNDGERVQVRRFSSVPTVPGANLRLDLRPKSFRVFPVNGAGAYDARS